MKGLQPFPDRPSSTGMASTRVCESKTSGVVDKGPAMARAVLRTVARTWKPLRVLFAGVLLSAGIKLKHVLGGLIMLGTTIFAG